MPAASPVPRRASAARTTSLFLAAQGATHWDALGHIFYDAKMWNGYDCRRVTSMGAELNDIANYRDRITGRAVLLDLPRAMGVDWCQPGQGITTEDLLACAEKQGVEVRRGDIVLFRFGQIAQCRVRGQLGRLRRRRRPRPDLRHARLDPGARDRGPRLGHLGRRGAAERPVLRRAAVAPGGPAADGSARGRDLRPRGAGRRLRRGRGLRDVLLRQPSSRSRAASEDRSTPPRSSDPVRGPLSSAVAAPPATGRPGGPAALLPPATLALALLEAVAAIADPPPLEHVRAALAGARPPARPRPGPHDVADPRRSVRGGRCAARGGEPWRCLGLRGLPIGNAHRHARRRAARGGHPAQRGRAGGPLQRRARGSTWPPPGGGAGATGFPSCWRTCCRPSCSRVRWRSRSARSRPVASRRTARCWRCASGRSAWASSGRRWRRRPPSP